MPATWSGEAKHLAYQWKRCDNKGLNCNPIGGANETTYVLRGLDVGHKIEFKETATNAAGSQHRQLGRHRPGDRRRTRPAGRPDAPGHRPARTDAARLPRQLERGTDRLRIPLDPLQQRR